MGSSSSHSLFARAARSAKTSLFVFALALFTVSANPAKAHADVPFALNWGSSDSNDLIQMQDGGSYAVALHVSKPAQVGSATPFGNGFRYGVLYYVPDPLHASTTRQQLAVIGGLNGVQSLSWEKPGTYQIDVISFRVFLNDSAWHKIGRMIFGGTAYADTDPNYVGTIQFTITDQNASSGESNVLFIPGLEGSRLYNKTVLGIEQQDWEPGAFTLQNDAKRLYLNTDGTSINTVYLKANGAIDSVGYGVYGYQNIYGSFLQQLAQLKASSTIADYLAFPYDWRQSPQDIVANGALYDDGTYHHLDQVIAALASSSKTSKVTIIAHSNGGLIAKALMIQLQQEGKASLIDKIIFVDVPQLGTPIAIPSMLHGDFQDIPLNKGFVVSQATARGLGENMPDAYDLLPSQAYFAHVQTPVVSIMAAPTLRAASGLASTTIINSDQLAQFLITGRKKPDVSDVDSPDLLSSTLLANAAAMHATLDNWQPPAGVQVIQIAGWGIDTPASVSYFEVNKASCKADSTLCSTTVQERHVVNMTREGDNTVVIPSQDAMKDVNTYYINVSDYNKFIKGNLGHADITNTKPFQDLFLSLLASSSLQQLPQYVSNTEPILSPTSTSIRLRTLSPVTLNVYDNAGNHTGIAPNPIPGSDLQYIEENIPGSYYHQYGEGQYVALSGTGNYKIVLHGTDTGTFTFEETPTIGGIEGSTTSFADVPVTASSTATIAVNASNPASSTLALDINGDGKVDVTIASSTQTLDPIAYEAIMQQSIAQMDIGNPVQRQLQAKLNNVAFLLKRIEAWDTNDDDPRDANRTDRASVRAIRKLNKIEDYIQKEIGKPVSRRDKDERIIAAEASAILDMIEKLKTLIQP